MTPQPEQWGIATALFRAISDLAPEQRAAFLERNCPDLAIRAEVERLLSEHNPDPLLGAPERDSSRKSRQRFSPGQLLAGRFRIVRFIAAGGMGEVYEAEDLELGEHVAIKAIHSEILERSNALSQFEREVHLARKVTHCNVCRIFDLFRHKTNGDLGSADTVFVSMELLHGKTLAQTLEQTRRMSMEQAFPLVKQMASALAAAHSLQLAARASWRPRANAARSLNTMGNQEPLV
jgi:eukaryotic-like serine/threonine-protein kinase